MVLAACTALYISAPVEKRYARRVVPWPGQIVAPDQGVAALAWLDAPHGQDQRPVRRPGAPPQRSRQGPVGSMEAGDVDPVVHHLGGSAELVAEYVPPVLADHQDPVRLFDGLALAVDE